MRRDLLTSFRVLEAYATTSPDLSALPVGGPPTRWGEARLAIDQHGVRHVLIPMPAGRRRVRTDERSSGIHIGEERSLEEGRVVTYVDIACLKPHLQDLFAVIADEILDGASSSADPPDVVAERVLSRWRGLLDRGRREGPTDDVLAGLFGELLFLRRLAAHDPTALRLWTGPAKGVWDFYTHGIALELKTSRTRAGWSATISSVNQLDTSDGTDLVLAMVKIERVDNGDVSVMTLVEELVAAGVDRVALYESLDLAGLSVEHHERAAAFTARLMDERAWRVGDDFPRLTRASFAGGVLPLGVTDVKYGIDLTASSANTLTPDALDNFLHSLATR